LAALLLGIGLSRFAFTPLVPALVQAGWFDAREIGYLGAANLTGYLIGAAIARRLVQHVSVVALIKAAMVIGAASFFACAAPLGFSWYFFWRLSSGVIGGVLMVLAPTAVLAATPGNRRGRVAGIVFTGVGIGIALSGTVIPPLVSAGLPTAWVALGITSIFLTALAWVTWPRARLVPAAISPHAISMLTPTVARLLASYALIGLAFAPHTVFWTDFIARGLGKGLSVGGTYWVVLGLGATCGPMLTGFLAEHLGFGRTYTLALALLTVCIVVPVLLPSAAVLALTSFVVGACGLATTSLGSGRASELVPIGQHRQLWGWMTIGYALVYAGSGYLCAFVFAQTGSYTAIFVLGGAAGLASTLLAWSAHKPRMT
jgi:MFS family permease